MGDGPSNIMSPQMFVDKAEQVRDALKRLGKLVWMTVLRMKELVEGGFGGIIGVGQSAAAGSDREPALIHLSYSFGNRTAENSRRWAMVGMNGMKGDIMGASDQLYAFKTAVETGVITNGQLHVVLCVAENSVSAWSCRPGDVLTMHSGGRTVEVSNTDAVRIAFFFQG